MTARISGLSAAFLRAGLLAAVLAVIAGILGMHVMTANHSSHAGHADVAHLAGDAAVEHPAGHSAAHTAGHAVGHGAVGHSDGGPADSGSSVDGQAASQPDAGTSFTASASCSSGCPGVQQSGTSCIPSAKAGSLAVVPPPAAPAAAAEPAASALGAVGYSFTPSSPTPCELSISRT